MLLEMASLEGRGSLCGNSRHWGSQDKVDTTPVQTAWRGAPETPVHWVMGMGLSDSGATGPDLTLCNPMDCSPPGSSVLGILQTRILEWAAMPFSRGSYQPRG